ncbi:MAG: hypothetical protein E7290_14045 [Lachnospiraceae bacterium]|nr:hypothetical protein [Lachnospiraceae bacterium]
MSIYPIENQKSLFLYTTEDQICLRTSTGDTLSRPVILCNDYAQSMSDTIYNGTIHYAYQNTQHDILIRSITDLNTLYKLSSQDTPDCFHPQITVLNQQLLLFYVVKNPLNESFCIKCICPFYPDAKLSIPHQFSILPTLHLIPFSNGLILVIESDEDAKMLFIQNNFCIMPLHYDDTDYKAMIEKLQSEHSQKQHELEKNFSMKLNQLSAQIAKRDKLIESAKVQYNELMETAIKYRDEAVKWRNKFYKED